MTQVSDFSEHDSAIWYTRQMLGSIRDNRPDLLPSVPTTFPPRLGPGERVIANGAFRLLTHRATGDGSYAHDSSVFFATGRLGLAATAVLAGVRAVGNRNRRAAAAAAAVPHWVVDHQGALYVSTHGFYLDTGSALLPWTWHAVDSMQLVQPGVVHVRGQSGSGPVSWMLTSHWAELVFVLWCVVRHPEHPQLLSGAWMPPGWGEREARRRGDGGRDLPAGD